MKFPKKFPEIRVSKYLLRETKKSDAKFYFIFLTDAQTIKHTSYDVRNIAEIENWVKNYKKQFKENKQICWTIEDTETGKVIGQINIFDIQSQHDKGEIGYFLSRSYWGKGLMTMIMAEVMKYVFRDFKIKRLQAIVTEKNLGSRKLLIKNNFIKEGHLRNFKRCRGEFFNFDIYSRIDS